MNLKCILMASSPAFIEQFVTLKNGYKLWTRRSESGTIPVIFVHGGPGGSCTMLDPIEEKFRDWGYKTVFYSQLGSIHSDNPNSPELWTIDYFTDHLEEIRVALGLNDFYLFGYSFGVVLCLEYALRYPGHARGLILSDFTASTQSFQGYVQHLRTQLSPESQATLNQLEATGDFANPAWGEIIQNEFMRKHFCILNPYPSEFHAFMQELNWNICQHFFGKNDFVVEGAAKGWDRWADLPKITIPTLAIAGEFDQCSPHDSIKMAQLMPHGQSHIVTNASHMPFYENPEDYFAALSGFLKPQ